MSSHRAALVQGKRGGRVVALRMCAPRKIGLVMKRLSRLYAICLPTLVGAVVLLALPGATRAELLATSIEEGKAPLAVIDLALVGPKTPLRVAVRSLPVSALDLMVTLRCHRGVAERNVKIRIRESGPIVHRVRLPLRRPDSCFAAVRARFGNAKDAEGRITLRVFGRSDLAPPLPPA